MSEFPNLFNFGAPPPGSPPKSDGPTPKKRKVSDDLMGRKPATPNAMGPSTSGTAIGNTPLGEQTVPTGKTPIGNSPLGGARMGNMSMNNLPTASSCSGKKEVQWTEKYRPKNLNAIAAQKQAISLLRAACEDQEFPNFLFYGPPGVGKTTAALAFCRELFGADYEKRVLEMNASDERGIDAVRSQVKHFSQLSCGGGTAKLKVKVIILDEADQMTRDAQSALRRIMEQYVKTTRFIILCNYVSRIIDPIHSRCMKFEFAPVAHRDHLTYLKRIVTSENIMVEDEDLKVLLTLSAGDLRKSTTLLQMAYTIFGKGIGSQLTKNEFYQLYQRVPEETLINCMRHCFDARPEAILSLNNFITKDIEQKGHCFQKFISDLFDFIRQRGTYSHVTSDTVHNKNPQNIQKDGKLMDTMKIAYISKLIADANEAVAVYRGSEILQMRHLLMQVRMCVLSPSAPVPAAMSIEKVFGQ